MVEFIRSEARVFLGLFGGLALAARTQRHVSPAVDGQVRCEGSRLWVAA